MRPSDPFALPPVRKPPTPKRDTPAEAAEKLYVRRRDRGCVARNLSPCDGPLDVDHVRASGGLGMKSPTHRTNLVVLCRWHHRLKTEYGKTWRPLLLDYLDRHEPSVSEGHL